MPMVAPSGHPPSPPSPTVSVRRGWDGLWAKRIAKKHGRGRLASMYADAIVVWLKAEGAEAARRDESDGGARSEGMRRRKRVRRAACRRRAETRACAIRALRPPHTDRRPRSRSRCPGPDARCPALHILPNIARASRRIHREIPFFSLPSPSAVIMTARAVDCVPVINDARRHHAPGRGDGGGGGRGRDGGREGSAGA